MRRLKIAGYGVELPTSTVMFGDQTRYRVGDGVSQLDLAQGAVTKALRAARLKAEDLDLIISASAVGVQPIPSTAALIHERIAKGTSIPAMDVNTTCTSFVTALDVASLYIATGTHKRVLIVSSEVGSRGLNPHQEESWQLFSDGAVAFIFEGTREDRGVILAKQATWSEGAHDTEIRGGLTGLTPYELTDDNIEDYQFDMKGKRILSLVAKKLPGFMGQVFVEMRKRGLYREDIALVVPHQASRALGLVMRKLGFEESRYMDLVKDYGNMVSASIPFALAKALDDKRVGDGDVVMLMGTAAGLTTNALVMKL